MNKPASIQIGITERCNLRCLHCDIWKSEQKKELEHGEWINILTVLKNWLGHYRLDISGGEPFLRKDLIDIIRFCHENGIRGVVTTNATLLTEETIGILSGFDTLTLNVSLDGFFPHTHDYLRGVPGTYKKVTDVLQKLKRPGRKCSITIATILMGYNCDEILDLVGLSHEQKLADGINFQALDHNFRAPYLEDWFEKSELWPRGKKLENLIEVIKQLSELKNRGVVIYNSHEQLLRFQEYFTHPSDHAFASCASGQKSIIFNPEGEVFLCWNKDAVGSVCEDPPEKIWNSFLSDERRGEIAKCRRTCRILNCNY